MITEFKLKSLCFVLLMGAVTYSLLQPAIAATADISELGKTLTPFGAERTGNADDSIPVWDGGYTKVDPSYKQGGTRSPASIFHR